MESPVRLKVDDSHYLLQQLEESFQVALESKSNHFAVPLTMACAATLESLLNDALVSVAHQNVIDSDYKKVAQSFLSMTLGSKLDAVIPLATKYEFLISKESTLYQSLKKLITTRNQLLHNKSFVEEVPIEEIEEEFEGVLRKGFKLAPEWQKKKFSNPLYSLKLEEVTDFIEHLKLLSNVLLNYGEDSINTDVPFIKKNA